MQLQVEHNLDDDELCKAITGMAAASGIQDEVQSFFDATGTSRQVFVHFDDNRNIVRITAAKEIVIKQCIGYVDRNGIVSPGGTRKQAIGQSAILKRCHRCSKISVYPPHKVTRLKSNPHMCVPCSATERATGENNLNYNGGMQEVHCADCGKPALMRPYEATDLATRPEPYRCRTCYEAAMPKGTESPIWMGGKAAEEYPEGFDDRLKESIRARDGYRCRLCGDDQSKQRRLDVHHIDYHKNNSSEANLISLCNRCHQRTNFQRKYWKARLTAMMNGTVWEYRRVKR